ncbi:MAG: AAA domain-containing protein, partial [Bryobacteraceae bacterium]
MKGPPGTGKSHTIANLISHLLAYGQRVLVTAQAPKALEVLLHLLPEGIRKLCVTALGHTREAQQRLFSAVSTILAEYDRWPGPHWAQNETERLERELASLEAELARLERELLKCREAETYPHSLPGGYEGTAAQIARKLQDHQSAYDWFPELPSDDTSCPLDADEIRFLCETHAFLTPEKSRELALLEGPDSLPTPEDFRAAADECRAAEQRYESARTRLGGGDLGGLEHWQITALQAACCFLTLFRDRVAKAAPVLGDLCRSLAADLLLGQALKWQQLLQEGRRILDKLNQALASLADTSVAISSQHPLDTLLKDVDRRLEGLRATGWRRVFRPLLRKVRETRYLLEDARVNHRPPRDPQDLEILKAFLAASCEARNFARIWPGALELPTHSPALAATEIKARLDSLASLLELCETAADTVLQPIPSAERAGLADPACLDRWRCLLEAEIARRQRDEAERRLRSWLDCLREAIAHGNPHPCLGQLAEALHFLDVRSYSAAWRQRQRLLEEKERVRKYSSLLARLQGVSPDLAEVIRSHQGQPDWYQKLARLADAWAWASARAWLRKATDPDRYSVLAQQIANLQQRRQETLKKLTAHKALSAFFRSFDDRARQNLVAWSKAMQRIGKGTGAYAWRHRADAQRYLRDSITAIPAWIMPLYKVWESATPDPGMFDTVIVDEASQAGVDSLVLLLLAKRIIIVGDDKQNSPEAVGIREDHIDRLKKEHLGSFHFAAEFRPDTSLYDHAWRTFGSLVSLREHFRCVPEIIRFCNENFYREAPLVPLRQPPPQRLEPIKTTFVDKGFCEGHDAAILNRAEALAIADAIQACLDDPRYEDKTMGVIVLQGHRQVQFIAAELTRRLPPDELHKRKLLCGTPAAFQGDQRDVIFLSLVVAPNHSFRALTEIEAQRRFNVAVSRARDQIWLFHSVQLHDLRADDLRYRLLHYCLNWQDRSGLHKQWEELEAEIRRRPRLPSQQPPPYESWFEVDVAIELRRRGYRLIPQHEVAGYRIDLVIEGDRNRLAIECDGDAWHGPDQFQRDLHRQRQLERAGWKFLRIRESEFYSERSKTIQRIVEMCQELDIQPANAAPATPTGTSPGTRQATTDVVAPTDDSSDQDGDELWPD